MASNEEEPMEGVEDNDTKLPLPKPSENPDNNENVARLQVSLWSPHEIKPKKFKNELSKTLQTWANKNGVEGDFTATEISEDGKTAVIRVTPADALKELLNLSGKFLTTKEKTGFTITFEQQEQNQDEVKGAFSPLTEHKAQNGSVESRDNLPPEDENNKPCLVALGPYWYVKNLCPDKIQRIERENGVKITENVAVTIKPDKKTASPQKASDEFTELVQSCLGESGGLSIPHKTVGSEQWQETLKFLKTTDGKCQITISSDKITIFGPHQYQVALSKSLQSTTISSNFSDQNRMDYDDKGLDQYGTKITSNLTDHDKYGTNISTTFSEHNHFDTSVSTSFTEHGNYSTKMTTNVTDENEKKFGRTRGAHALETERKSSERVKFTTSIKDPFVSDGLEMEDSYWHTIKSRYQKEVDRIQAKYNVRFREAATSTRDKKVIKVRYNRSERNVSMESHAIRALLRLYQKVVLSQFRPTSGSCDDREEDLYQASSNETDGATAETSKNKGEDIKGKGLKDEEANKKPGGAEAATNETEEEMCPVCIDTFKKKTTLKCKHGFCEDCLEQSVKAQGAICPVCKDVFGKIEGDQPEGTMKWHTSFKRLPGFDNCGTIEINYNFPDGTQTAKHPHPGQRYSGTHRTAYLPDNAEGNEVLQLLKRAFDQRLIFTVGMSRTSGVDNTVTWNDIHHKTSLYGGPQSFGYPDPNYLRRVKEELKAKGIK